MTSPSWRRLRGVELDDGRDLDPLPFLRAPLPPCFARRSTTIAPGADRAYDDAEWGDALIVVERGEIELVGSSGPSTTADEIPPSWSPSGDGPRRSNHEPDHQPLSPPA
jgi:hypothetical protein